MSSNSKTDTQASNDILNPFIEGITMTQSTLISFSLVLYLIIIGFYFIIDFFVIVNWSLIDPSLE
jgi:hypothetical protein